MPSAPDPVRNGEAAPERHAANEIEIFRGAGAHVPADLDRRIGERGRLGRLDRRPVEKRAAAAPRREQFVTDRIVDHPDLDQTLEHAGDRDAEMRHAAGEIDSAVDRVDHPDRAALAHRPAGRLLADEAVVRKGLVQAGGDQLFGLAVDLGQIVLRSLEADLERGVEEPPAGERAGLARHRLGGQQAQLHRIGVFHGKSLTNKSLRSGCRSRAANVIAAPSGATKRGGPAPSTRFADADDRHARRGGVRLEGGGGGGRRRRRGFRNRRRRSARPRTGRNRRRSPRARPATAAVR